MSLAALNSPPLVALTGLGIGANLSLIDQFALTSPWNVVRIANLVSYGINFMSVQRPGRLDGQASEGGELAPRSGKTLVAPAGWAFAIWGPIFLGEMVGVVAPFFIKESAPVVEVLRQTSGPFIAAQIFQSLWCAAFRPKYKGWSMFVSTGFLSATAYSLSRAHAVFAANSDKYSNLEYGIFFLPMALHFGWTSAASLVNLNGSVSMQEGQSTKVIKYVGHLSVLAASALGVYLAKERNAPVYTGVIAWALAAVADGMKKRLDSVDDNDKKKKKASVSVNLDGAKTQYLLSKTGSMINALGAAFVAGSMSASSKAVPKF
jgi:hypothetical protein